LVWVKRRARWIKRENNGKKRAGRQRVGEAESWKEVESWERIAGVKGER
jgi:hypothetical protein